MPKIVTAQRNRDDVARSGKDQAEPQNPLEIDREGNRTHLKIAAVDALNPAAALAKREAKQKNDLSGSR